MEIRLYYDERGLDRYFGLLDLGEIGGLWKNVAGRYEIDGKKVYAKQIYKEPKSILLKKYCSNSMRLLKKSLVTGMTLDRIELTILRNLIHDEEFLRKVLPFIEPDYFDERTEKVIFEEINNFAQEYDKILTLRSLLSKFRIGMT